MNYIRGLKPINKLHQAMIWSSINPTDLKSSLLQFCEISEVTLGL